jgi:hypothetical protein
VFSCVGAEGTGGKQELQENLHERWSALEDFGRKTQDQLILVFCICEENPWHVPAICFVDEAALTTVLAGRGLVFWRRCWRRKKYRGEKRMASREGEAEEETKEGERECSRVCVFWRVFLERRRCRRGEKLASRPRGGNNTRPREKLGDVNPKCEGAEIQGLELL